MPEATTAPRSKGEIALSEPDRLQAAGLRFGTVLADAGYGVSAAFRHGLDARGLRWAVGIVKNQKVYTADVRLVPLTGPARKPSPDREPREAEAVLADLTWRHMSWREGTKGKLSARFAAIRVRAGDGPVWGNNRHLPGANVWLVGEWRSSGERNTTCPTCRPRRHGVPWQTRSRRAGSASRPTSSSRQNSASTISRDGPGPGCIDTR
nr:transposase [Methylobacterium sp. E-041]